MCVWHVCGMCVRVCGVCGVCACVVCVCVCVVDVLMWYHRCRIWEAQACPPPPPPSREIAEGGSAPLPPSPQCTYLHY